MNERNPITGRRRSHLAVVVALLIATGIGCSREDPPQPAAPTPTSPPSAGPPVKRARASEPAAEESKTVELRVVDRTGFDSVLSDLQGQVVLVDFWATWCLPCVEQLPHSIALADERAADGLAVVTVCMEDPDRTAMIQEFLAARDATSTVNLLSQQGGSPAAMEAFDIAGGAVPHYKLYDRTGQLRKTFGVDPSAEEQFTSGDIESAVNELLGE